MNYHVAGTKLKIGSNTMTEQPIRENFFDFHTSYHLIVRLTIFLLFISTIVLGQQSDFDLKKIKFNGLAFSTTKEIIIKSLGEGKKVEPNYECGFFANDQDGGPYYQLVYNDFNYIGSDKEKFLLEKVGFDVNGTIKMNYGDKLLSGQTTESDFVEMFGENIRDNYEKRGDRSTFLLYSKGSDDGALFIFEKGRLHKFEYWSPC